MIKAYIFDLDGTTINTIESLRWCVSEALGRHGVPGIDSEQTKKFVGNGGRELIRRALSANGIQDEKLTEEALATYKVIFRENCTKDIFAYEGFPEVISELKKRGMKLAVLSNKGDNETKACIKKCYGDVFDRVYGERKGIPLKPDPQSVLALIKELGVDSSECVYVGDGDTDMEVGKSSGCVTVAVSWGYRPAELLRKYGPDRVIDNPAELLDY